MPPVFMLRTREICGLLRLRLFDLRFSVKHPPNLVYILTDVSFPSTTLGKYMGIRMLRYFSDNILNGINWLTGDSPT